ncbi:MAG: hypothetical protein V4613_02085 [Bacteroidota bacterium]
MEQEMTNSTPKRPTFLTVLCILTFIGSAWGIVGGFTSIMTAKTYGKVMDAAKQDMGTVTDSLSTVTSSASAEAATEMINTMVGSINEDTIRNNGIASIIASIFTLVGALLMWKLRKMGFWVYVLGVLISIVAPVMIYSGNLLGAISAIGMGFIGILFIILYAVNRKHLVN